MAHSFSWNDKYFGGDDYGNMTIQGAPDLSHSATPRFESGNVAVSGGFQVYRGVEPLQISFTAQMTAKNRDDLITYRDNFLYDCYQGNGLAELELDLDNQTRVYDAQLTSPVIGQPLNNVLEIELTFTCPSGKARTKEMKVIS